MPTYDNESRGSSPSARIDNYSQGLWAPQAPRPDAEKDLARFGLDPFEVELIMARFVDGKPMKQIVKDQGWLNSSSANYFLRKVLKKLREGRFCFNAKR